LCKECARQDEKIQYVISEGICNLNNNFSDLLTGFIGNNLILTNKKKTQCEICNMSFQDFQRTGKLGCGKCYETFFNELAPVIARIHGNVENKGKMPKKILIKGEKEHQLELLRKELKDAISGEEYEEAAKIRDIIREIEAKNNI